MGQCTTCGGTILVNNPLGIQEQVSDACICTNGGLVLQEQESQNSTGNPSNQKCCVVSVNGKDGVVNLTTTDIPEGVNLYFTNSRARQTISAQSPILYNPATGVIAHKVSGIVPNTYGSATQYPVITVDEWGHITGVTLKTLPNSSLDPDLQAIANLNGQGYLIRTAPDTWVLRSIVNTPGRTEVLNGDGVNAQTRIDLAVVPSIVPNTYGSGTLIPVITVDAYGRITAISTTPVLAGGPPLPHTHSLGDLSNVDNTVDTAATVGSVLVWDGVQWTFGSAAGVVADNGLTVSGGKIQLGGTLVQNTQVTTEDFKLEFLSTNTGTGRLSGIRVNEAALQNTIELFTQLGTQYSRLTIIENSISQSAGISPTDLSNVTQNPVGFIFSGAVAGNNTNILELITNGSSTKQIKVPTYPSSRNDSIAPVNFLHTDSAGNLISSPVSIIAASYTAATAQNLLGINITANAIGFNPSGLPIETPVCGDYVVGVQVGTLNKNTQFKVQDLIVRVNEVYPTKASLTGTNKNTFGRIQKVNTNALQDRNKEYYTNLCGESLGIDTYHGNVFYVSKQYTGTANAVITGLTLADITSTNVDYTTQLNNAAVGSIKNTYPCPWSARNAALDAIAAGEITNATIVILPGNHYTIGSDDATKNGSKDGLTPNSNVVADIGFAITNNTFVASLLHNNIIVHLSPGVELDYINSSYNIHCIYELDSTDTIKNFTLTGQGTIRQWYGQNSGFAAVFCNIDNANSIFMFEAQYVQVHYWRGFTMTNVGSFNIKVKTFKTGYCNVLTVANTRDSVKNVIGVFTVDYLIYGNNILPNSNAIDLWSAFFLNGTSNTKKLIKINIGIAECVMGVAQYDNFNGGRPLDSAKNFDVTFDCDVLIQTEDTYSLNFQSDSAIIGRTYSYVNNCTYKCHIKYAETTMTLFGIAKNTNLAGGTFLHDKYHCDLHVKKPTTGSLKWNIRCEQNYLGTGGLIMHKSLISGKFINDTDEVIYATDSWANATRVIEFSGQFITKGIGKSVAILSTYSNKQFIFNDALLVNDGTVPCVKAVTSTLQPNIYFKNIHANSASDIASITEVGESIIVEPDLINYV